MIKDEATGAKLEQATALDHSYSKRSRRQDLGDRIAYATLLITVLVACVFALWYLAGAPWPR